MKAMILAAGLGARLRPLTDKLPKPLLPIADRSLIEYTLLLLRKHGVSEVVINLHYQGDQIRKALGDGSKWEMKIRYSEEPQILGTGGAIKEVEAIFSDAPFIVINSDILVEANLSAMLDVHRRNGALATLALREDPAVDVWGSVEIDSKKQIRKILGRPDTTEQALSKRMFSGIHVMEPDVLAHIPSRGFSSIIDVYIGMLQRGKRLIEYPLQSYWKDIGTPDRYREAQDDFKQGRVKLSYLPD